MDEEETADFSEKIMSQEIVDLRNETNTYIDGLAYLTLQEKEAYKNRVGVVETVSNINAIKNEATIENAYNKRLDDFEAKQQAIHAAKTSETIYRIVADAKDAMDNFVRTSSVFSLGWECLFLDLQACLPF